MKLTFAKLRRSLFFKLLLILVVTGFAINLLVFSSARRMFERIDEGDSLRSRILNHYFGYLTADIGDPPAAERLQALEAELGVRIRIEDMEGRAHYGESLPAFVRAHHHKHRKPKYGFNVGRHHDLFFASRSQGSYRYIFYIDKKMMFDFREEMLLLLLAGLSLIIFACFLAIRRQLRPVKVLEEGVTRIKAGDLSTAVPVYGKDELGDLTASFNEMTDRIRQMIAAKEQLLSDVSHELRSPVTRMKLGVEMLESSPTKESLQEDLLEIQDMISAILDTARLQGEKFEIAAQSVDLSELIDTCLRGYPERRSKRTHAEKTDVQLDPTLAKVAIRNVIDNAMKYGSPEGEILVSTRWDSQWLVITIRDDGPGIPQGELNRVLEPFYRVDPSRQRATGGVGLGLHLCARIVSLHRGSLTLRNCHPGLEVEIRFPQDLGAGKRVPGNA